MKRTKSKKPSKQRKKRANLPLHRRHKKMSITLKPKLKKEHNKRNLPVREGDKVKVLRGDYRGRKGEVKKVNLDDYNVEIKDIETDTQEGERSNIKFPPSNLMITKLNLEDEKREEALER